MRNIFSIAWVPINSSKLFTVPKPEQKPHWVYDFMSIFTLLFCHYISQSLTILSLTNPFFRCSYLWFVANFIASPSFCLGHSITILWPNKKEETINNCNQPWTNQLLTKRFSFLDLCHLLHSVTKHFPLSVIILLSVFLRDVQVVLPNAHFPNGKSSINGQVGLVWNRQNNSNEASSGKKQIPNMK